MKDLIPRMAVVGRAFFIVFLNCVQVRFGLTLGVCTLRILFYVTFLQFRKNSLCSRLPPSDAVSFACLVSVAPCPWS